MVISIIRFSFASSPRRHFAVSFATPAHAAVTSRLSLIAAIEENMRHVHTSSRHSRQTLVVDFHIHGYYYIEDDGDKTYAGVIAAASDYEPFSPYIAAFAIIISPYMHTFRAHAIQRHYYHYYVY
jgi:hypothetical protein